MKNLIISGLVLGAVCTGLVVAQSDDEMQRFRQELANLGLRVAQLEHASGMSGAASTSASTSGSTSGSISAGTAPARTMIILSVSQSDHTDDHSAEIASLKRQHASLMNTVNQAADQEDEDFGQQLYAGSAGGAERGWGQAAGGRIVTSNVGAVGRQVLADSEMKNRYATQAAIKKEKLERLQRADADPKQIIHGHDADGRTIFTLETKFDLSESLNSISVGDTVTWTGTRQSADSGEETWFIDSIRQVR